jgi:NAD(P)-dependent dehydrogenase (short-subunit alcohol dehydrogenase family)
MPGSVEEQAGQVMQTDIFSLKGRVALVTGASSGLGRHFARVLAGAGADVAVAARRTDRLEALTREITASGRKATAIALDVTEPASVKEAFADAEARLGPISVVVNNAGIAVPAYFLKMTEEEWRNVLSVNLDGVFRVAQEGARRMKANGTGGSIVNIASVLGLGVIRTLAHYSASKAGVIHMTKAAAYELARDGIRVNAIAPGYCETEMNAEFFATEAGKRLIARVPMERLGRLEELDGPLLLLASDAGSFMTGSVITVDGGLLLSMV